MRTLFLSAALAIMLHVLLFSVDAEWLHKKALYPPKKESLSLSIDYIKPPIQDASISTKSAEPEKQPGPLRKEPENNLPTAKPIIKKQIVAKTVQASSQPEEVVQKNASLEGLPSPAFGLENLQGDPEGINKGTGFPPGPVESDGESGAHASSSSGPAIPLREAIPVYRENPAPPYPLTAIRRGHEGTVVLEVLVNREGRVDELRLHQSSGYSVLDKAAMDSVKGWVFEPATIGEEKRDMWVKVPVRFQLRSQ